MNHMTETAVEERIDKVFAEAIATCDTELLGHILDDKGEFEIKNEKVEVVRTDKAGFIQWITQKRTAVDKLEYYFDQCLHCSIGSPVVIFNNGEFPKSIKDSSAKSKTGFMLNIKDQRINEIKFCYTFLHNENKYGYEIECERIKKYMDEHKCSFDEAYPAVTGFDRNNQRIIKR